MQDYALQTHVQWVVGGSYSVGGRYVANGEMVPVAVSDMAPTGKSIHGESSAGWVPF